MKLRNFQRLPSPIKRSSISFFVLYHCLGTDLCGEKKGLPVYGTAAAAPRVRQHYTIQKDRTSSSRGGHVVHGDEVKASALQCQFLATVAV